MAAGVEPFHWGLTVEELNQSQSKEGSADFTLREDTRRLDIELPHTPLKTIKIIRGRLTALIQVKKSAGPNAWGCFSAMLTMADFLAGRNYLNNPSGHPSRRSSGD